MYQRPIPNRPKSKQGALSFHYERIRYSLEDTMLKLLTRTAGQPEHYRGIFCRMQHESFEPIGKHENAGQTTFVISLTLEISAGISSASLSLRVIGFALVDEKRTDEKPARRRGERDCKYALEACLNRTSKGLTAWRIERAGAAMMVDERQNRMLEKGREM